MCDYDLSDEQKLLRQNIRDFAENEIAPLAQQLDETETFSVELTKKMAKMGLFGIVIPEEYGGSGMDYLSYIIAVEELARIDGSQAATVAPANSIGIGPIFYFGSEAQKREPVKRESPPAGWSSRRVPPAHVAARASGEGNSRCIRVHDDPPLLPPSLCSGARS